MELPLRVLVVDSSGSAEVLCDVLRALNGQVLSVEQAATLLTASAVVAKREVNMVFIDPFGCGLDAAGDFIFRIRKDSPAVVFVLFLELSAMERYRQEFFAGERRRFSHYFKLDKGTPAAIFRDEVRSVVQKCQRELRGNLTEEAAHQLQQELLRLKTGKPSAEGNAVQVPLSLLQEISEQLKSLTARKKENLVSGDAKSVFFSHRFAEADYIDGLTSLLEREGFAVVTGQDTNTHIGQAIIDRIKACRFFLCLMTKAHEKKNGGYTTSPWLLEEKGAALAFGKQVVLMVEEGVEDVGGLQGDWQRIHFSSKGFTKAAIRAIDQLKSYSEGP